MATTNFILKGFNPANALASGVYVKVTSTGAIDLPSATDKVIGSVEYSADANDVAASRAVTVRLWGPTRIVAVTGAPITAGDLVYLASGGIGSNVQATGAVLVGVALENAAANADQIEIAEVK